MTLSEQHLFGTKSTKVDLLDDGDTDSFSERDDDPFDMPSMAKYNEIVPQSSPVKHYEDFPMPTFNAMISQSDVGAANISAVGILEQEEVSLREEKSKPSMKLKRFAAARAEVFSRNMDFAQAKALTLSRSLSGGRPFDDNAFDSFTSSSSLFGVQPTKPVQRFQTIAIDDNRKSKTHIQIEGEVEEAQFSCPYVESCVEIFGRNVDYAQARAEALTRLIGELIQPRLLEV